VRRKGQPRLEDQCDDAGPVEEEIASELFFHVMPTNVVHDEGECMQERQDKESVGNPSVENLKSLVRNSREKRDPVCLTRGCTGQC
jgi:hypothetical protein